MVSPRIIFTRLRDPKWWVRRFDRWSSKNYFIKKGYIVRSEPAYFSDDTGEVTYQPDVYPYAADLAVKMGCTKIIDIGCGRASKLAKLHEQYTDWTFVGVDFGENIEWCKAHHKFGTWIEADLEYSRRLRLEADCVMRSIIICSDVIEHLINPVALLRLIRDLMQEGARVAVFSTPDRTRVNGAPHNGPPSNECHVREWDYQEFQAFLMWAGFSVIHLEFTRSNDIGAGKNTILSAAVLS